ncbi:hypothetical protein BT69DRAFT_128762 [Atractiella rhizophila]|nr:hypothetical protein BT69DRAFT_128762 [Atractiella rhizophila]
MPCGTSRSACYVSLDSSVDIQLSGLVLSYGMCSEAVASSNGGDNTNVNPATIRSLGGLYYDANLTTFDADNAFIGCPLHRIHPTVSKALRHLGHIDDETTDSFVTMRQAMLSVIFEVEEEDPGQELANNEEDTGPAHIDSDIQEEKDVQEANDVIAMEMDIREPVNGAGRGLRSMVPPRLRMANRSLSWNRLGRKELRLRSNHWRSLYSFLALLFERLNTVKRSPQLLNSASLLQSRPSCQNIP